jgi:tetratricopeptide (TPR) repeat protein
LGGFLPIAEHHERRLSEIEKKALLLQASGEQFNKTAERIEKRITDIEGSLRPSKTPSVNPTDSADTSTQDQPPSDSVDLKKSPETKDTLTPDSEGSISKLSDISSGHPAEKSTKVVSVTEKNSAAHTPAPKYPIDEHSKKETVSNKIASKKLRGQSELSPYAKPLRERMKVTYQEVIKSCPETSSAKDAYLGLAALAEEENELQVVIDSYTAMLALIDKKFPDDPNIPQVRVSLANAQMLAENYDAARENYLFVSNDYPNHPLAPSALESSVDCLKNSGRIGEAKIGYEEIELTKIHSVYAQNARLKIADILIEEKHYEEAIKRLQNSLKDATTDALPKIELKIAQSQMLLEQYPQARDTISTMLKREFKDPSLRYEAYLIVAKTHEGEDIPLKAAHEYAQIASTFPTSKFANQARLKSAQSYLAAEQPKLAIDQCELLINAFAGVSLGNDTSATKESRDERTVLEPQTLYTQAKALQKLGSLDHANAKFSKLRESYPLHDLSIESEFEEIRGVTQAGKTDESLAMLQKILKAHPNTPKANRALVEIQRLKEYAGKTAQGLELYADLIQAASSNKHSAQYRLHRALLLDSSGRTPEATPMLEALVQDTQTPEPIKVGAIYALASVEQRAGRLAGAVAHYEKMLEWAEKNPSVAASKELKPLIDDAKWKVKKLRWLMSFQTDSEVSSQP